MADPIDLLANGVAAGLEAQDAGPDRFFGVVRAVNTDGTLTVESGVGIRTSVRALGSYAPRTVGDTVLCVVSRMGPVVQGKVGSPTPAAAFTLSDSSAPGGQGWEETVTGQVWAKTSGAIWMKRTVALPPPTGGSVSQGAGNLTTYRGGTVSQANVAEQGDYSGNGMQTGLATFGSWAGLSGHTATGGTLTIHRRSSGHGFTYGPVVAYARKCAATGVPTSTPTVGSDVVMVVAALNETPTVGVPASWAQDFCTGAATAVAFYSDSARDNIEIDSVTLTITY